MTEDISCQGTHASVVSVALSSDSYSMILFELSSLRDNLIALQSYNETVFDALPSTPDKHVIRALPVLAIIDEALKGGLWVQATWNHKERLEWFIKKVEESIGYIEFCKARDVFFSLLGDQVFSAVEARINNEIIDIEVGKYSFTDVCVLAETISRELVFYENASD